MALCVLNVHFEMRLMYPRLALNVAREDCNLLILTALPPEFWDYEHAPQARVIWCWKSAMALDMLCKHSDNRATPPAVCQEFLSNKQTRQGGSLARRCE